MAASVLHSPMIRVLAVDDHALVRDGIAFSIQSESDMTVVAQAATGQRRSSSFACIAPM